MDAGRAQGVPALPLAGRCGQRDTGSVDDAGALRPWVEGVLSGKIEEVTPENLSFEPQEPPFPVWRVVLVVGCILVVAIFALLVWLLVKFIRNRRLGGRSGR